MSRIQSYGPIDPLYRVEKRTGSLDIGNTASPPVSVTINKAVGQSDPTSSSPILFTIVFSEPVAGLSVSAADLSLSSAGGTLTDVISGSGATYTVTVTGMTTSGDVVATLPAGSASSIATGMSNAASTSTDNIVAWV